MNVRKIAYLAIYVSLLLILTFVPYTGYILLPDQISITTIPVFIAIATWHLGASGGIATSIAFGLGSYLKALAGIGSPLFAHYPELAILPRILMGLSIVLIIETMGKYNIIKSGISGGLTVVFNTLFFTCFYFVMKNYRNATEFATLKYLLTRIYINFLVELPVGIVLGVALFPLASYLKNDYENKEQISWDKKESKIKSYDYLIITAIALFCGLIVSLSFGFTILKHQNILDKFFNCISTFFMVFIPVAFIGIKTTSAIKNKF